MKSSSAIPCERVNYNSHIIDWDRKPKSQIYDQNKHHKAKSMSTYYLIDLRYNTNSKDETLTRFNFKKTTGHKKKYSCTGYGGKCASCRP